MYDIMNERNQKTVCIFKSDYMLQKEKKIKKKN